MTSNGIAIIGAGMIGAAHANGYRTHLPRLASKLPGLKLAQVCDVNRPLAEVLAATYGFEKVVSGLKSSFHHFSVEKIWKTDTYNANI